MGYIQLIEAILPILEKIVAGLVHASADWATDKEYMANLGEIAAQLDGLKRMVTLHKHSPGVGQPASMTFTDPLGLGEAAAAPPNTAAKADAKAEAKAPE